jgi:hypothetical protein
MFKPLWEKSVVGFYDVEKRVDYGNYRKRI